MGSYGIGVSRAVAAIAESNHDEHGLFWPREVAPADVHIVAAGKDERPQLRGGREAGRGARGRRAARCCFDDREACRPGVKFKDAELIGVPTIVVVGSGLADGVVEVKDRRTGERARCRSTTSRHGWSRSSAADARHDERRPRDAREPAFAVLGTDRVN